MSLIVVMTLFGIADCINENLQKYCRKRESYKQRSRMHHMWER